MSSSPPLCPCCQVEMEYKEPLKDSNDLYDSHWSGHCPVCNKDFIYLFDIFENNNKEETVMAKFNDKVLCLFNKDYKQLKKEMQRRGMVYESREKAIAKAIWKDAYDAGVTEGKYFAALDGIARNCSTNCCEKAKPEVNEYCLYDIDNAVKYRLELTDQQVSAIEWLIDQGLLRDVELSDWSGSFEDVGRI